MVKNYKRHCMTCKEPIKNGNFRIEGEGKFKHKRCYNNELKMIEAKALLRPYYDEMKEKEKRIKKEEKEREILVKKIEIKFKNIDDDLLTSTLLSL